jgi:hypothetical protein
MPARADTKRAKTPSRAARFAFIAARLAAAKPTEDWFENELGLAISADKAERAIRPVRFRSPLKGARGRPSSREEEPGSGDPWILREWSLIRDERLGLIKVLITVKNVDDSNLTTQIAKVRGVIHVVETAVTKTVIATALFRDTITERDSRARIAELTDGSFEWEPIAVENFEPAVETWKHLAIEQGLEEGLGIQ